MSRAGEVRAHRRRRARARRRSTRARAGARPRRVPRRRQRRGARGPAPASTQSTAAAWSRPSRSTSSTTTARAGPPMSFVRDHYEDYDAPRLVVRLHPRRLGTPYLLLHGPEPDNRWEAFASAVRAVVERFGVHPGRRDGRGADGRAAHPADRAHPPRQQPRAAARGDNVWRGELRIPSSAQALLELRLGEWGHDAMGFVAHIPHYLAQLDYPQAVRGAARAGRAWSTGWPVDLDRARREAAEAARPRSPATSRTTTRSARSSTASSSSTTRSTRAEEDGDSLLAADEPTADRRGDRRAVRAVPRRPRPRPTTDDEESRARLRRRARRAPRPRDPRRQPVPRHAARTPTLQRVFGGQVAAQALVAGASAPSTPALERALAALLLPAARRHRRPDRLRRRADPRRPLVRDPAGRRPPARPADLLHDRRASSCPRRASTTRTRCPRCRRRRTALDLRGVAPAPRRRSGADELAEEWAALDMRYVGDSRPGQAAARGPRAPGRGPALDPGQRRRSTTTR